MCVFDFIRSIDINRVESYSSHAYLTFDMDWACDEVLHDTLDLLETYSIKSTWFVTHDTPALARMRGNGLTELGIHPNFNALMGDGPGNVKTAREEIERLMQLVPEARSVRSHSMTQSSQLLDLFKEYGLDKDCNHFIPHTEGYPLKPWKMWNGLTRVPYFWEDDVHILYNWEIQPDDLLTAKGLKVFDFHPVHIALNTESMLRYESVRSLDFTWASIQQNRFQGHGTRSRLLRMILSK